MDNPREGSLQRADTLEIRISADGRVFFNGLPDEMLELAWSLNPRDPALCRRVSILRRTRRVEDETSKENAYGDAGQDIGS